jgi:hypothetical protein
VATLDVLALDLAELARGLRQAGDKDLGQELTDAIHQAADPIPGEIRAGLKPKLPDRYAEVLDSVLATRVSILSRASNPGVSIRATTRGPMRRRIRRLDQGILEHPLFGNRRHWYPQPVAAGWFTQPNEDAAPRARRDIEDALDRVKDKIFKGIHG